MLLNLNLAKIVDHFVGKLSAIGQPTFHPFWVSKRVVIQVITWIVKLEIIKRQTRAMCRCMAKPYWSVCAAWAAAYGIHWR